MMTEATLIQNVIARGQGVIAIGCGRMLIYSRKVSSPGEPWYVPGCAFVNPDDYVTDEEREAALEEAKAVLREDIRKSRVKVSTKDKVADAAPSEE